jgi:hypothetical protein
MNLALPFLSLAAFATALMAGLFYASQWLVMPGLNATEPLAAVFALRSNISGRVQRFEPLCLLLGELQRRHARALAGTLTS